MKQIIRSGLQTIFQGFSIIIVIPALFFVRLGDLISLDCFPFWACFLSLIPGKIGSYLRVAFYRFTLESMSPQVYVGFGSFFSKREARVGEEVSIGGYCIIGQASIGERVEIASRVSILSGRHQHLEQIKSNDRSLNSKFEKISIGSGSWIGEGAVVMADIGEKCIVGAGAVVAKPFDNNTILAGNPARVIKYGGIPPNQA